MAKNLYPSYRAALLDNGVDLISGNVKIAAVSSTYTYSAAHDFHNDLSGIVTTSGNLASKTATAGSFDAADISVGSPAGGSTITGFVLYLDTGTSATSPLVYYWSEDSSGTPISISTNGEAITVQVNASGFFTV